MTVDGLTSVRLHAERIPGGLALTSEAGWNQVAADWQFMLGAGSGFGFADPADRLIASGLTVDFPDYAWISMILVTPQWQRRGLATRLMERCIGAIEERGLVPALDASPAGREVYLRLGFRDAGTSTRFAGELRGQTPAPAAGDISPITGADLAAIAAYERRSSGTDRSALLSHLAGRLPDAGFVSHCDGRINGFVMARDGRMSAQIGPLVAEDDATAADLLGRAADAIAGPFCLDLFDQHAALRGWLDKAGFVPITRFIRMVHGPAEIFPEDHRTYVIAGPELG
jgi:GNAT superfamily N-acetyltransferase